MPKKAQKSQDAYLACGGTICPLCHAAQQKAGFTYDAVQLDGNYAYQNATCNRCGSTWTDEYRLTGFEVQEFSASQLTACELLEVFGKDGGEAPDASREGWQDAVAAGETDLGYWDWAAEQYDKLLAEKDDA